MNTLLVTILITVCLVFAVPTTAIYCYESGLKVECQTSDSFCFSHSAVGYSNCSQHCQNPVDSCVGIHEECCCTTDYCNGSEFLSTEVIVACVAIVFALLVLIVLALVVWWLKRTRKPTPDDTTGSEVPKSATLSSPISKTESEAESAKPCSAKLTRKQSPPANVGWMKRIAPRIRHPFSKTKNKFQEQAAEVCANNDPNNDKRLDKVSASKTTTDTEKEVDYSDRSSMKIPSIIPDTKLQELLSAIKGTIPTTLSVSEYKGFKPEVVRIVTYGTGDQITACERTIDVDADEDELDPARRLLCQMLRNGPMSFPFDEGLLIEVLSLAKNVVEKESSLVEVPIPCVVYGDIHGQYSDLFRWFNVNGWPNKTRALFLGDLVDRGSHGIEVVALLAALKVVFPDSIYLVRGNHEEELMNKTYSFYEECASRFIQRDGEARVYESFKGLFSYLPLAGLVGDRILGVHGGISPRLRALDDIRAIKRPLDVFMINSLACDLVWSDPDPREGKTGFQLNMDRRGIGQHYAEDTVTKACKKLGIDMIMRGHQAPLHGYAFFSGVQLLTIFSAPGYKGIKEESVNMGACAHIDKEMQIIIRQIKVTEQFRRNRIDDMSRRKLVMNS